MTDVIAWLESPEGESWSRFHNDTSGHRYLLVTVVPDGKISGDPEAILLYA